MAKQLWLNNFDTELTGAVKALPDTGSPATELGYGIIQLSGAMGTVLPALTGGDWFLLTLFKIVGGLEDDIEIVKVTSIDTSGGSETRLTVERGYEGTTVRAFDIGDKVSMRLTAGSADNFVQKSMNLDDIPNPATALANLGGEPTISAGTSAQYWRGDKSWRDFSTDVRGTVLTGLSTATNAAIVATDTVLVAHGKLQAQVSAKANTSQVREKLTANRTYYVRTDGSDSNDGLANTSGGAFLTIQKAVDTVASIDTVIYSVTVSVGAGTFGGVLLKDAMGAGSQWLTGAGAGSTIIETASAHCLQCGTSRKWVVQNLTLQNSGGTSRCVLAAPGSAVNLSSVDFGPCAAYHMDASGGSVTLGNYTVSGGGMIHWYTANGGQIICAGFSVTFSGTPTFSSAVAHCDVASFQRLNSTTFTGAVNGKRYNVLNGGVIYTAGAGETFLPGSTAGTVGPGGQYA